MLKQLLIITVQLLNQRFKIKEGIKLNDWHACPIVENIQIQSV